MKKQKNVSNSGIGLNWVDTASHCPTSPTAGYTDWRLPNIKELTSLLDFSKFDPSLGTDYFTPDSKYFFWSSTYDNGSTAWAVEFRTGKTIKLNRNLTYPVRCERGSFD